MAELSIEFDSNNLDISILEKMELDRKDFLFRHYLHNCLNLPTDSKNTSGPPTRVFVDYQRQGTCPEDYFKSIFLCELRRYFPQVGLGNIFVDGLFLMVYNHVCTEVGEESCFEIEAIQDLLSMEGSIELAEHLFSPDNEQDVPLYNTIVFTFMSYLHKSVGARGINSALSHFYDTDSTKMRISGHNMSYHTEQWRIYLKTRQCDYTLSYGTLRFLFGLIWVDLFLNHYFVVFITVIFMLIDVSFYIYSGQVEAAVIYLIASPLIDSSNNVTTGFYTFENQKPLLITCTILVGINVTLLITDLSINALLSYLATVYGAKHRRIIFSRLHGLNVNQCRTFSSVNLISLFGEDIDSLQQVISTVLVFLGRFIFLVAGGIIISIIIHYSYIVFFSFTYVVLYLLGSALNYFVRNIKVKKNNLLTGLTHRISDIYDGFYENLHYNLHPYWEESTREKMKFSSYGAVVWKTYSITRVFTYLMYAVNTLFNAISYLIPVFLLLFTEVRFEQALGALFIFFRLIRTPVELLNMYDLISKGAGAYSRLESFKKFVHKRNSESSIDEHMECVRPNIQLDNVYLSHFPEYGIWSLFDVNLTIPFGQRVAIVGSSGSGKSSILNIILGFLEPTRGNVIVRNNGSDICLRQKGLFGVVLQFPHTFNISVSDNLKVVKVSLCEEDVISACESVSLHQWVMSLPLEYDSLLQKHGKNMSGGQRQRLAIAQAILSNASVIVADECTSALDHETTIQILDTLFSVTEGKTLIFATNRFDRLDMFDVIHVMAGGRVVESGSFSNLMEERGVFHSMHSQDCTESQV